MFVSPLVVVKQYKFGLSLFNFSGLTLSFFVEPLVGLVSPLVVVNPKEDVEESRIYVVFQQKGWFM